VYTTLITFQQSARIYETLLMYNSVIASKPVLTTSELSVVFVDIGGALLIYLRRYGILPVSGFRFCIFFIVCWFWVTESYAVRNYTSIMDYVCIYN